MLMASKPPETGSEPGGNGHRPRAGNDPQLVDVAVGGDQRATLEALRDKLARLMDGSPGVIPQVAAQLRATLKDIAELPAPDQESKSDELARRREARRAEAQARAFAAGEGQ